MFCSTNCLMETACLVKEDCKQINEYTNSRINTLYQFSTLPRLLVVKAEFTQKGSLWLRIRTCDSELGMKHITVNSEWEIFVFKEYFWNVCNTTFSRTIQRKKIMAWELTWKQGLSHSVLFAWCLWMRIWNS